jgi:MFS family permease
MIIPGLPEMGESQKGRFPGQEAEVGARSAGLFNAFLGFGQVLAPAYGTMTMDTFGWRTTTDIVAVVCFVFAATYFLLGGGQTAFE